MFAETDKGDVLSRPALLITTLLVLLLVLGGCAAPAPPAPTPTADPDAATPADIVAVRTAAVDYLREGARCFVPGRLSLFRPVDPGEYNSPSGYEVYRFNAENCLVTVTRQEPLPAEPLYHVAIGDQDTGYCLQAIVSANGGILHTGTAAADARTPGNFSASFCEEQGYTYDIVVRDDGSQCGSCIFPDGSSCRSWDFFHGVCGPGEENSEG